MYGASGLSKDLVPAWNQSFKGNVTFDDSYALNFHKVENQAFEKKQCDNLKKMEGIVRRVDEDKRDITVRCWTDMFINEYLTVNAVNRLLAQAQSGDSAA